MKPKTLGTFCNTSLMYHSCSDMGEIIVSTEKSVWVIFHNFHLNTSHIRKWEQMKREELEKQFQS